MTLFLTASSFYSIFTQVPKTFNRFAGRFLEASWRCCHSSSGFSLSQFLHVTPDRLDDDDEIRSMCEALAVVRQKSHWTITMNGKMNVWKCELIFPTDRKI